MAQHTYQPKASQADLETLQSTVDSLSSQIANMARTVRLASSSSKVSHVVNFINGTTHLLMVVSSNGNAYYIGVCHTSSNSLSPLADISKGSNISYTRDASAMTVTFTFGDSTARDLIITDILLRGSTFATLS